MENKDTNKAINNQKHSLRMIIIVVDKEYTPDVVDFLESKGVLFSTILQGEGTATSEILDLLNLGETDKEVLMSVTRTQTANEVVAAAKEGAIQSAGILLTLKLSSIGGTNTLKLLEGVFENAKS